MSLALTGSAAQGALLFVASATLGTTALRFWNQSRGKSTLPMVDHQMQLELQHHLYLERMRVEYSNETFDDSEKALSVGPFVLFSEWLNAAREVRANEPNAMALATVDANGRPVSRYVLLKGLDESGFVWYTNYNSRKGQNLAVNPFGALTFWWCELQRQVRVEGHVQKVSEEESDQYFACRPRSAQLGAWASSQSEVIASRFALEQQLKEMEKRFEGVENIPRPPHWGGYRLIPNRLEFWKGRSCRVHDRILFERNTLPDGSPDENSDWVTSRLQP